MTCSLIAYCGGLTQLTLTFDLRHFLRWRGAVDDEPVWYPNHTLGPTGWPLHPHVYVATSLRCGVKPLRNLKEPLYASLAL